MRSDINFIAEVSSNHHRSQERCIEFIDQAAQIGCSGIKFQLFRIDEMFSAEILRDSHEHQRRRDWELPTAFVPVIARHCREREIAFGCTPFYLDAVNILAPYADFLKVASYELLWDELLASCAATYLPIILSTGMATLDEIDHAVSVLRKHGCVDLTLLHAVSSYPTPIPQCNLAAIRTLQERFFCPVGWSDHSVSPTVIHRAIDRWNATTIEFHLDLDGQGAEYEAGHCWLPEDMASVIGSVRLAKEADGDGIKQPMPSEEDDRTWRADPSDGLRPLRAIRSSWTPKES